MSPGLLKTRRQDCEVHDLEMLSGLNPDKADSQFICNYYLGQLLFQELWDILGREEFNQRLGELYRLSLALQEEQETPGISEVRQAFHDRAEIVEKHWTGRLNAPENRPFDEGRYRRNHELIQWDQYPTYNDDSITFSGTLLADAVLSKPQSTERSGEGGGTGHHRDGEGTVPADMGRAEPVAGLLAVRGAAHEVAEGSKELSLADSCGASGRDLRLAGG